MSETLVENIKALTGALSTSSPHLLLTVAWPTKNEARNFQMCREVSSFDFTQCTNDQNKSFLWDFTVI